MEKFGVIKKKSLLFIMVAGLGGLEQGPGGREPRPPQVLWMDSIASQLRCVTFARIILHCPQAFEQAFGEGT